MSWISQVVWRAGIGRFIRSSSGDAMPHHVQFRLAWHLAVLPLLFAVGLLLVTPLPALAATITVTTTDGGGIVNNACSLVEALDNANQNMVVHTDCLAAGSASAADVIAFNIPAGLCPGGI